MLPSWLTKPETIFTLALYITSPAWFYLFEWVRQRIRAWNASQSERSARAFILYLQEEMEHPPTLVGSLAFIICFLPLPFMLAFLAVVLHFVRYIPPPFPMPHLQDTPLTREVVAAVLAVIFLPFYILFGLLTVHGIKVAYRLRFGAAHYADHYRMERQRKIDEIRKQFPRL